MTASRSTVDSANTTTTSSGGRRLLSALAARPLLVAPSILSADFARLRDDCARALDAGGDLLHVDVMDGHFVPNLSMGPAVCAALHAALPDAILDVHLMVSNPQAYIEPFANAGAGNITFHAEVVDDARPLLRAIRALGINAGLAINPDTPASALLPYLDELDLALIMSVHPGFSGQKFLASVLHKTSAIRAAAPAHVRVEMDGGVNAQSAASCISAGCDVLVAATAIFAQQDYAAAIRELRAS